MQRLIRGVHKFQTEVFGANQELFAQLEDTQAPHTLFITCSDSRINPHMLTQTEPGEIFILRNAGNIVPTYGVTACGEGATIEFAITVLDIEHIVVCGHSNCGAMKALVKPSTMSNLPAMRSWLHYAEVTRRIVEENYSDRTPEEQVNVAIQENVLCQIDHLRTHPSVAARLERGKLQLYGWVFKIPTGEVFAYDPTDGQFKPLSDGNGGSARTRFVPNPDAVGP